MHSDGCSQRKQSTWQAACSAERAHQRRSQRRASAAHRVCCREDRRACRQGADDACLGHLHARRVDDQHAISMQSACNQHAISMHSVCTQYAISMHSACTHHEISMQSACNHRDRLLLHSFEERLVLSASHLIELVDAAAALSGRTRCNQHAISRCNHHAIIMKSACNHQEP